MSYSMNYMGALLCALSTFCSGQEGALTSPEKPSLEKRLVEKRLRAPLMIVVPSKTEKEEGLPARFLPTPSAVSSAPVANKHLAGCLSKSSVPRVPVGNERFSWTPDTPAWKKPFIWIKEYTNKLMRSLFDEPSL